MQNEEQQLTTGIIADSIFLHLKNNFKVEVDKEKIRNLSLEVSRLKGISTVDKFKFYKHVGDVQDLYQNAGIELSWDLVEELTGNLLNAMRQIEKLGLDQFDLMMAKNKNGSLTEENFNESKKYFKEFYKKIWSNIEKNQIKGNSNLIQKIKK